jgi:uncharacterized protein (TIGR03067 family)
MRHALYFAVPILSVVLALAADRPEDAKTIQGAWTPSKAELGGKPVPDAVLKTIKLKLDNGKYEASVAGEPDIGTYTLDVASKPKGMTVNGTEGPNKGKSFPAVYELDGDTVRICYDLSGAKRPTDFRSTAGTKLYVVTYERTHEKPQNNR